MIDPFALPPRLWFGVLCNALGGDQAGRVNLQGVFNQVAFMTPPEGSGVPPHGFLNGILAVGFSEGLGHFEVAVDLLDIDGNVLWTRADGAWSITLGPGESNAAVLAERVQYWFKQPGRYHFRIRLTPEDEHQILFEVAAKIGPGEKAPDGDETPEA